MDASFDVFLGHDSADKDLGVREFADRLEQQGLRVFVDERAIGAYEPITREVEGAIAGSLAFVAWYSATYPSRRACQLELQMAYVYAASAGEVGDRILVVNPEEGFAHIHPATLCDALIPRGDATEAVVGRVELLRQRRMGSLGSLTRLEPPSWVPQRHLGSDRFVGRVPELWTLHEGLQAGRMSQVSGTRRETVALVGLGGSGKSLLAEKYADDFGQAYPGGIYWLSAVGAASGEESVLLGQLTMVAEALEVPFDDQPNPGVLRHRLVNTLKERQRALWLVDDLPGGLTAEEAQAWAAPHEQAATLITTRSNEYPAFTKVELDMLDEHSAYELLTSALAPAGEEEQEAARLIAVDSLGRQAQALDVASSLISRRPGSEAYREFLRRTREGSVVERLEHAAAIAAQLPNGHEASIVATYRAAIEGLGGEARDALRLAGRLAAAPIELDFAAEITAGDAETSDAAADRIDLAVGELTRASLARTAVTAGRPACLVHELVAAVAHHIDPHPDRADTFRTKAVTILTDLFAVRDDLHEQTRAAQLEARLTHARHLIADVHRTGDTNLISLAGRVASLDYDRGDYASARQLYEGVLAACVRLFGEEHPNTLASKTNLAPTLLAYGELEGARRLNEDVLAAQVRLLGEEHPDTLASKSNLAETLRALDELGGARQLNEEVLAARVRLLGEEHPDTLTSKSNLALTLFGLGDFQSARRLQEEVLSAEERLRGETHPDTLTDKNNLASTLLRQGDLEGARRLQEEVLAARVLLLGEQHPHTLTTKSNLASTLSAQGDLEGARQIQEEVLAARLRVLGEDHPDTLTSKNNLGGTLYGHGRGDLEGARRLQEEVVAGRARLLGEEHPDTLNSKRSLATTLWAQGELEGVRRLEEEVLSACLRLFGEDHPDTLAAKSNLAETLRAQPDLEGVRRLEQLLGEEHLDTLVTKNNLAESLRAQGELNGAQQLGEEVLAACVRLFGEEHPNTLISKFNLASTLVRQGDLEGARRLQEEVLAVRVRLLGEEDEDTLTIKNHLAATLLGQEELEGARRLQEEVLAVRVRLLGEEHEETLISKNNLAETLRAQGELNGAQRLGEEVLAVRARLLGEEHPDTLNSKRRLAQTLWAQGDLPDVRRLEEEVLAACLRLFGEEHRDTRAARSNLARTLRAQGDLDGCTAAAGGRHRSQARAAGRRGGRHIALRRLG